MRGHTEGGKFHPHRKTGISTKDITYVGLTKNQFPMKDGKVDIEKILKNYVMVKRDFPEEPDDKPFG